MTTRRTAAALALVVATAVGATAALASDDAPAAARGAAPGAGTTASSLVEAVYGSALPADYRTVAPTPAFDVPGAAGGEAGELLGGVEVASTGRTAEADGTAWLEVKVPGRTTGWVRSSSVERM